jgi:FkbM family methyltransferase
VVGRLFAKNLSGATLFQFTARKMLTLCKLAIQKGLRRAGIYDRVRASVVYDLYWRFCDQHIVAERNDEVAFYRYVLHGLSPGDVIFDIGANQGYKADIFLRLGARVVAVDPDPLNHQRLQERFVKYRVSRKPVEIVCAAVSDSAGTEQMWIEAPGSAKNTLSDKWVQALRGDVGGRFGEPLQFRDSLIVETTTLEALIAAYGVPFFVKIDVEGHEARVLRGLKRSVPFVSFEVNLPEFRPEGRECAEILHSIDPAGEFNYAVQLAGGLVLKKWATHEQFRQEYPSISEASIEVFWRASRGGAG